MEPRWHNSVINKNNMVPIQEKEQKMKKDDLLKLLDDPDIQDKIRDIVPTFSGNYNDLTNKPSMPSGPSGFSDYFIDDDGQK